jgi:hypothetical protein
MENKRQAVATVATSDFAGRLAEAFTSFAINPLLELHAFIIGQSLPEVQLPGVTYHLEKPDPSFGHPMRDLYYRRFLSIDQLGADYVLLVDNSDVLCIQELPELRKLLRDASFAACVEHAGGRYLEGQQYTSCYVNAGVTYWHVPSSRRIREDIVSRGRARFRSVEDQLSLNEVIQTRYYDQMILLPCQYGYRACLEPVRIRGWPTVNSLDGVVVYHNRHCIEHAKKLLPAKPKAVLPDLTPDERPLSSWEKFWRRVQLRAKSHTVK